MKWKTQFDDHERVIANSGLPVEAVYHPIIDKETGHYELELDTEVRPIYEEIQSYADSCDIKKLVARYNAGEVEALNKVQGIYGDLTSMPKNIFEFFELEEKVNEHFNKLPVDVKQRFDNSYLQYAMLASTDPDEFYKRHDMEAPKIKEEISEGGKEE